MPNRPDDYWRTYTRPNPRQQALQKRAWSRALSALRRHHVEEFERYYRAELDKEERLRQLAEFVKETQPE